MLYDAFSIYFYFMAKHFNCNMGQKQTKNVFFYIIAAIIIILFRKYKNYNYFGSKKKINATHKCHPSCWCLISIQVLSNVCKCTNNEHIHKIQSQSLKLCFGPFMYIEKRLKNLSQKIFYVFVTIWKKV